MIKIAIIEDEKPFYEHLCRHISAWAGEREQKIAVTSYLSADSFLLDWGNKEMYDVIFIDIVLPGTFNGIELSKHIRRYNENVSIIFVTSIEEEMRQGFEVAALQYLIKPAEETDDKKCMDKVLKINRSTKDAVYCYYKNKNTIERIPFKNILYFSSSLQYTDIYTLNGVERQLERLKNIEENLPEQFVRCHRSIIVNIHSVYSINRSVITLIDHSVIPISRTYLDNIRQKVIEYFR